MARLGLQGKLTIGFLVVLSIALVGSCWLFVGRSRQTLSDIMGEHVAQLSLTLAQASRQPMQEGDPRTLAQLGRDLLKSRNIVFVGFFDPAGRPLAVACRDPDWEMKLSSLMTQGTAQLMQVQQRSSPSLGDYLQVVAPVVLNTAPAAGDQTPTRLVGYVAAGVSQGREQQQLQHISLLSLAAGSLIFLLSLPLTTGLVRRILLPIRQLVSAAGRLAAGHYDAQVAVHRPDEIGTLARSFNEMVDRVRQQQEELRVANAQLADANRSLEEKVLLRTQELAATNQRLSSEIAEKEDFLRAVSHDLNAPLRNIGGMATMLLLKYSAKFDEDVVHRLQRIQKNVEVESDLIGELLELSRIKTRRQKFEPVETGALVHDVAAMFDEDLKTRGIVLSIQEPLPVLICEKTRLRQVFQNLIDNAIKYMGNGPVRQIHISGSLDAQGAQFRVRDTGLGIDAADQARVFYVFRRGNNAAQSASGKGVGLASVKSIVETYQGRIWVQSEPDQGSTFCFTIHRNYVPALGGAGPIALPGGQAAGNDNEDAPAQAPAVALAGGTDH